MFDYDKWQEILNTLHKHKLRTLLTALGVWWGIFMLIVLIGAGTGLQNGVIGMFGDHARNAVYMWTNRTTMAYDGFKPGRRNRLTMDDMKAVQAHFVNQIEHISPRYNLDSGEVTHNGKTGAFEVRGETSFIQYINPMDVIEGRFLNPNDITEFRKVVVIGQRVRDVLFKKEESPIGQYLKMRGGEFLIIGVFQSKTTNEEEASEDEQVIIVPITTAQRITNRIDQVHYFVFTVNPKHDINQVEDNVALLLKSRHKIHPDDPRGINSNNIAQEFNEISNLFAGIKAIIWIVGIGSLLAGIIGVSNIMLIIVKERTREIGLRKALGAEPKSIISMILLESVVITTTAGYIGLLSGVFIVWLIKQIAGSGLPMFTNPQVHLGVGLLALVLLSISGAIAGLIPAINASNIPPVEALREE